MTAVALEIVMLLCVQLLLVGVFFLALIPMSMYKRAGLAVLKRNFTAYFSNPTGYVFLCLFVLLTSFAAFWPHDFFNSNMATLHQLNDYLPYIMLIFVPAITMSIWAEERRERTDELLLTIPATDFDIVLGKYLAAAATFSASLIFSQLCNYTVLSVLAEGNVDFRLFLVTYFGYWLIGLAMISVGMVASFLTKNLTVGFVLGVAFNAPLVFAGMAEYIVPDVNLAQAISRWSIGAQFEDFGRGVVSISSLAYFLSITVIGIYLSVVMIGRRHWYGGRDGRAMLGHYLVRTASLAVVAVSATYYFNYHDLVRADLSSNRISSLSPDTERILDNLQLDRSIYVEAYISKTLPEAYVKTKYDINTMLREIKAKAGDRIEITVHDALEPFSQEAQQAQDRFGIRPRIVQTVAHGAFSEEPVFLSAVVSCGLERVVIPFFGQGNSVEYELIRAISTAAAASQQNAEGKSESKRAYVPRRTIGIVTTDAQILGTLPEDDVRRANMGGEVAPLQMTTDLRRQYNVVGVDPSEKIETGFLFSLDKQVSDQLDRRSISQSVRKAFQRYAKPLPKQTSVALVQRGMRWQISYEQKTGNGTAERRTITIKRTGDRLNVYDHVSYDVLLVVQPSTMSNVELTNLIEAIRNGQPAAIFEDPMPVSYAPGFRRNPSGQSISPFAALPPTDFPRNQRPEIAREVQRNPQLAQLFPPPEKGDIERLWNALGIRLLRVKAATVPDDESLRRNPQITWQPMTASVWQSYNPYPKIRNLGETVVFANPNAVLGLVELDVFNPNEPAVSDLDEVTFILPGSIEDHRKYLGIDDLKLSPLVRIGGHTGMFDYLSFYQAGRHRVLMQEVEYKMLFDIDVRDRIIYVVDLNKNKLPPSLRAEIQKSDPSWPPATKDEDIVVTVLRTGEKWRIDIMRGDESGEAPAKTYMITQANQRLRVFSKGDWTETRPIFQTGDAKPVQNNMVLTQKTYTLAARISTRPQPESKDIASKTSDLDAIVVADADVLGNLLWTLRDRPTELGFKSQNSAFVLNVLDELAGDDRFLDVRQRQVNHATLQRIEKRVREARKEIAERREVAARQRELKVQSRAVQRRNNIQVIIDLNADLKRLGEELEGNDQHKRIADIIGVLNQAIRGMPEDVGASVRDEISETLDELKDLQNRSEVSREDVNNLVNDLNNAVIERIDELEKKYQSETKDELERIERERREKEEREERELNLDKLELQNKIKLWAVVLPPIPPLVVGMFVLGLRRWRERESISEKRLRKQESKS